MYVHESEDEEKEIETIIDAINNNKKESGHEGSHNEKISNKVDTSHHTYSNIENDDDKEGHEHET